MGLLDPPQGGLLGGALANREAWNQSGNNPAAGLLGQYIEWQRNRDHPAELSRLFSDPMTALGFAGITRMPRVWLGEGASSAPAANASFGRPMSFPDSTPTSAANAPFIVFDARSPSGHLGVFDSADAARRFIENHPDSRFLDYDTPKMIRPVE